MNVSEKLWLHFLYSFALSDHLGDAAEAIRQFAKLAGLPMPPDDADLSQWIDWASLRRETPPNGERRGMTIPVDCAVNDDHGCTSDRIAAIHFPGLELDALDMRGPRFRELPNRHGEFRIKIGRREWGCQHLRSCVGNIYWERYGFEPWHAAALLHWLRREGTFTLDGGYEELANWWDSGIVDDAHVQKLLIDAAKDDRL